jgi:hypothetical protein
MVIRATAIGWAMGSGSQRMQSNISIGARARLGQFIGVTGPVINHGRFFWELACDGDLSYRHAGYRQRDNTDFCTCAGGAVLLTCPSVGSSNELGPDRIFCPDRSFSIAFLPLGPKCRPLSHRPGK